MASFFNLGTDETPRWINMENSKLITATKIGAVGKSEVRFQNDMGQFEVVRGEAADRLIAQLGAHPELKKSPGV